MKTNRVLLLLKTSAVAVLVILSSSIWFESSSGLGADQSEVLALPTAAPMNQPRVVVESEQISATNCGAITNGSCVQTRTGLSLCRLNNVCVAKVDLSANTLVPKVAIAPGGGTAYVSSMASNAGALAAINGDYFSGCPDSVDPLNCGEGLTYIDGVDYTDYREPNWVNRRSLGFNDSYDPNIGFPSEQGGYHRMLLGGGPQVSFNGEFRWWCGSDTYNTYGNCPCDSTVTINFEQFSGSACGWYAARQTFVGLSDDGNTLYLAVSEPYYVKTVLEMHDILWALGARNTLKMDGGGSSSFYFNDGGYSISWDGEPRAVANSWVIVPYSSPPPDDAITIYENADYTGTQYGWHDPGSFNFPDYMNDKASSIRIASGWSARLYEHNDQEGGYICVNSDDSNFADNSFNTGLGLNDQASSIEIYNQDTCPSEDMEDPTVSWIAPVGDGEVYTVDDQLIDLEVSATDDTGVSQVVFYRWDYQNLQSVEIGRVSSPPYRISFDTGTLLPEWNQVDAIAYDSAGKSASQHIWLYHLDCYTLATSVSPLNSGTVSVDLTPNCSNGTQYRTGTTVSLTANPSAAYVFELWSGSIDSSSNPVSVLMDGDKSVTAHFLAMCPVSFDGWKGEYWNNVTLSGPPALCRDDPTVDFEWYDQSPDPLIQPDQFSARWTKDVYFDGGWYTFTVFHDDGFRLYFDGSLFLSNWCDDCRTTDSRTWLIGAGFHELKLEMVDYQGWAAAQLSWPVYVLPPYEPTALVATPVSESRIDLTWVDNSDNEDGFRIERSLSETADFEAVATVDADVTSYSDSDLSSGTTYYYRVYAFNTAGDSWTYAADSAKTFTPPYEPSSPTPADGATGVPVTTGLSWIGGDPDTGDTVTYDVYFGTTNPPTTLLCNDTSSPTCDPGTLAYDTDYYWYIVATDNHGASTTGPVWAFTTGSAPNNPPYAPSSPTPADGATDVSTTTDLSWSGGDPDAGDTVAYDVFFGTTNPPTTLLCNDASSPTCDPGTLSYDTDYYWYVVATDNHGASTTGPVWAFTTGSAPNNPPYAPSSPTPADGATGVSVDTNLFWTGGDPDAGDTVAYDVFFGTTNPPTTLHCDDASSPTCDPGTLDYETPYYWFVVATDNHGYSTEGSIWGFTTGSGITDYIEQVASGETAIAGTIDGTFLDTQQNDGEAQSLQEVESGGKVTNRYSYLEHKWRIYVLPGDSVTLNANAWSPASTDGDVFTFAYSADDVHYSDMFTVNATSDDASYRTYSLPPSTSGWIHVRVTDSDHTRGNRALDTVFVDHLFVRTVNPLPPPSSIHVGDLEGSSAPGTKTRWDATVTITIHDDSEDPVVGATVSGLWSGRVTGTGSCTTDETGKCTITLDSIKTNISSVTFTVTSVDDGLSYYDSAANHDPDGDSDGTSITVYKTATAVPSSRNEPESWMLCF